MSSTIPPLTRQKERETLVSAARQGTTSLMFPAKGYHISGDPDVGKTWLLNQVDREIASVERAIRLHGNLEARWETLDPLEQMVGIRNVVARFDEAFDPEAFDLALAAFLAKFRPGYGFAVVGADHPGNAPMEESLRDAAKKMLEGVAEDLTGAGAVAGGSAAVVGAAKAVAADGAIAGVSAIFVPAATIGAITFVTATGFAACKHLLRTLRGRARRRGLISRYERLARFLTSDRPDHAEFFCFLAYLLGDAISRMRDKRLGFLSVIFLDASDALADFPEGPAAQVGRMLSEVFKHVGRYLVFAASRQSLASWSRAITHGTAPALKYDEVPLDYIGLDEAAHLARASGYNGMWPADGISVVGNNSVRPKELAEWWERFGKPPLAESEGV